MSLSTSESNKMSGNSLNDPNTSQPQIHRKTRNVARLLAQREISPRTKCMPRRQWGEASRQNDESSYGSKSEAMGDARRQLSSWVEAESLRHLSAKYCPLMPPPRSTIAAAFSSDGRTLASTHGDHTVKIIDCQTGSCLKVLTGHRRTPWVVRFHPLYPEILASGSLDHEVRIWNAITSECIAYRDFYRPIASIAFHAEGEILAVASGHKLYLWHYNRWGESLTPQSVLKTKRSLRAVHFHPHSSPLLLTAEVNDLDNSKSSMARATSPGDLRYPPPYVYLANVGPSDHHRLTSELPLVSLPPLYFPPLARDETRTDLQVINRPVGSSSIQQINVNAVEQYDPMLSVMDMSPAIRSSTDAITGDTLPNRYPSGMQTSFGDMSVDALETTEVQLVEGHPESSSGAENIELRFISPSVGGHGSISGQADRVSSEYRRRQFSPSRDPTCWELPFLQGWLMGQNQSGMSSMLPFRGGQQHEYSSGYHRVDPSMLTSDSATHIREVQAASLAMPASINRCMTLERSDLQDNFLNPRPISSAEYVQDAPINNPNDGSHPVPIITRIQSELAASLATTAAAELPCTVKLRVWRHHLKNPSYNLNTQRSRLTIPHAVLCSEMGAHFSPCGRFLAACVACVLPDPEMEADPGFLTQLRQDVTGVSTSPTRHPISACQVMYELRIYSLEEPTFGSVLISTAIRAAHCLTSIQFSPTSEHILLAYGRRHSSLLKSIVINGETSLPIYTVLEVYRVSDMELVGVLPSAEDEVNVACFHPLAGGGLVYGTKEGKLRILQHDRANGVNYTRTSFCLEENLVGVEHTTRFRQAL